MRTIVYFIIVVVAIAVGFFGFWRLAPRTTTFGMFGGEGEAQFGRIALSFSATILGVVLGTLYRSLRRLQESGATAIENVRAFFSGLLRSIDLWLGMAGSPIVFALVLQSTSGMTVPGLLLVGLENGFCCLIVVNAFVGRAEAATKK